MQQRKAREESGSLSCQMTLPSQTFPHWLCTCPPTQVIQADEVSDYFWFSSLPFPELRFPSSSHIFNSYINLLIFKIIHSKSFLRPWQRQWYLKLTDFSTGSNCSCFTVSTPFLVHFHTNAQLMLWPMQRKRFHGSRGLDKSKMFLLFLMKSCYSHGNRLSLAGSKRMDSFQLRSFYTSQSHYLTAYAWKSPDGVSWAWCRLSEHPDN